MTTIRTSDCTAYTEAPLGKVQPIPHGPTDPVIGGPLQERGVDPALENEILHEATDFVIGKGTQQGSAKAEATAESARDVIFTASFPGTEGTGGTDPALAGI
jgi:hypothetical protein